MPQLGQHVVPLLAVCDIVRVAVIDIWLGLAWSYDKNRKAGLAG